MQEIKRVSITDSVVTTIKDAILAGEYQPGQKLPTEARFCEMLKVSRTSIREAFRVLQALGYVTILPGKGAFVADQPGPEPSSSSQTDSNWYKAEGANYNDFMEVRIAVETLSVRLAVERATPRQVAKLQEVHNAYLEAAAVYDSVKLIMLDELFHATIVSFTNNQLLVAINKQLQDCFRAYRTKSFTNEKLYRNAVEPHARILDCFYTKDASRAVEEMRHHLELSLQDIAAAYANDSSN
ncbi:MAG: FadR/GntR family transcriptional regulator [Candidatus Onthomonas sp.]